MFFKFIYIISISTGLDHIHAYDDTTRRSICNDHFSMKRKTHDVLNADLFK